MSGISATDSFTDGAELFDQEKYRSTVSTSFEPDPIQMERDFTRPLSHRIITIHSGDREVYADYRVDDVNVRCPSEPFRQHQLNRWSNAKTEAESKGWSWTVTAIGSCLASAIGGVALLSGAVIASPVAIAVVAATSLVFIASLFVIANAKSSASQADEQISKWSEHPAYKIGMERDEAHKQGFPYIYARNLKLGAEPSTIGRFHPKQVEHEYKKHFEAFCKQMLSQTFNTSQAAWVSAFRQANPLSRDWMVYGLGYIPEHMMPVIDDHARFESFLTDIEKSYETLKSEVSGAAKERIEAYNQNRNSQLQPLAEIRDRDIAAARAVRDKIFEKHPLPTSSHHQDAQANFAKLKKTLEENYALRANPINTKFNEKIKEVENQRDENLKRLDTQKGQQFANNYHAAHELLVRAKQAWDNKGYQPVNFQQYFPYQAPQPAYGYQVQQQPAQPVYYQQPQPVYPQGNPGYGVQPSYGYQVQQQGYAIPPGAGG